MSHRSLTFLEHLEELRWHLVRCCVALSLAVIIAYTFLASPVIPFLLKPVGKLVFTAPAEAFLAHLVVAFFCGLMLVMPYLLYQFWTFASSGLTALERKYTVFLLPFAVLLFYAGVLFSYTCVLPLALRFFLSFSSPWIVPMITVSQYLSFVGSFCLGFGIVFEMPIVVIFLVKIGVATAEFLIQMRRHAIVIIFVISAIVTPPDWISQILMALPMIGLYELSICFARLAERRRSLEVDPSAHTRVL